MTRTLVTGITGQDGSYLTELLLARGDEVHGVIRPGDDAPVPGATLHALDLAQEDALGPLIASLEPDVVINLAAVSSVWRSWEEPGVTARLNGVLVAEALAAVARVSRDTRREIRFIQASSAEIFGAAEVSPQTLDTPIRPTSPYGTAKAYAHLSVGAYRAAGLFASSLVLYNHESPRRPETFVTRKITAAAARIAAGHQDVLELGNLDARRDWGWAPDYAAALLAASGAESPGDFIIATGVAHSVRDFVRVAFARVGIDDWESVVRVSDEHRRPTDAPEQVGDASRARDVLGWAPTLDFDAIIAAMVDADVASVR